MDFRIIPHETSGKSRVVQQPAHLHQGWVCGFPVEVGVAENLVRSSSNCKKEVIEARGLATCSLSIKGAKEKIFCSECVAIQGDGDSIGQMSCLSLLYYFYRSLCREHIKTSCLGTK